MSRTRASSITPEIEVPMAGLRATKRWLAGGKNWGLGRRGPPPARSASPEKSRDRDEQHHALRERGLGRGIEAERPHVRRVYRARGDHAGFLQRFHAVSGEDHREPGEQDRARGEEEADRKAHAVAQD